jgi:hypothetical protein
MDAVVPHRFGAKVAHSEAHDAARDGKDYQQHPEHRLS